MSAELTLRRVSRDTLVVLAMMAGVAAAVRPGDLRLAFGVLGGGALMALSAWAIRSGVEAIRADGTAPGRTWALVKYFTRHAILAAAAYGMMVRLHLDPLGMLLGVSSLVVAAAVEALRSFRGAS